MWVHLDSLDEGYRQAISAWREGTIEGVLTIGGIDVNAPDVHVYPGGRLIAYYNPYLEGRCMTCSCPAEAGSIRCPLCKACVHYRHCFCDGTHAAMALEEHLREAHDTIVRVDARVY